MAVWASPPLEELNSAGRWDAEAFSPLLRKLDAKLAKCDRLVSLCSVTHASEIPRVYSERDDALVFLLAQNIRPVLLDMSAEFRIPTETASGIPINRLLHGDVLVTRSGANSGTTAVYLGDDGDCYTSGEGLIVRTRGDIEGTYVAAYLNTIYGQALCRRAIYGSGQPHIGPKYLEQIRVLRLGGLEKEVGKLIRSAHAEVKAAESLYPEALAELLDRLGFKQLTERPNELSYVCDSTQLANAGRADPEFFQPRHQRLRAHLLKSGAETVNAFCPKPTRGVQPELAADGDVLVVDSKAVRRDGIDPNCAARVTRAFYDQPKNAKARIRRGDVLLNSTGRGTLGRASYYALDLPAISDNHVAILRPDPKICCPGYLSLFLNSPAGMTQSEQFQTGSSGQIEIYPEHILKFLVFVPRKKNGKVDLAWQGSLAKKIALSETKKADARAKLRKAMQLVEDAIGS